MSARLATVIAASYDRFDSSDLVVGQCYQAALKEATDVTEIDILEIDPGMVKFRAWDDPKVRELPLALLLLMINMARRADALRAALAMALKEGNVVRRVDAPEGHVTIGRAGQETTVRWQAIEFKEFDPDLERLRV